MILKSPDFYKKTAYLGQVHKAKFRGMVRPGDVLKLHIDMEKVRSRMGIVKAVAMVDDRRVCSAELTFIVAEREEKL